ncbi:MAG: hypothetical protein R3C20_25040 [Planctomycetaceae bacterium]
MFDRLLTRLQRHLGRYAIPNLTILLIFGQVAVFVLSSGNPELIGNIVMDVGAVKRGDWHRLLTFLFVPVGSHPVWAFFYYWLFYMMGTALEQYWGTFRYNMFLLIGYISTLIAAFILPNGFATNAFLQGTVFLAFAFLNPDFTLHLFFILPVKIKWLAMLTWIGYGLGVIVGTWPLKLTIIASVLNFLLFFAGDIRYRILGGHRHMKRQFRQLSDKPAEYFHKCTICQITDKTHPQMDFRYCAECDGDLCYCAEHIRNHEHVTSGKSMSH